MHTTGHHAHRTTPSESPLSIALDACLGAWLGPRLNTVFAWLDDRLFANAVGAGTREEQDDWFRSMQALRGGRGGFGKRLRECLRVVGESAALPPAEHGLQAWHSAFAVAATRTEARHAAAFAGLRTQLAVCAARDTCAGEGIIDAHRLGSCLARVASEQSLPDTARPVLVAACEEILFRELDAYFLQCTGLLLEAGVDQREPPSDARADEPLGLPLTGPQGAGRSRKIVRLLFRELAVDETLAPRLRALLSGLEPVLLVTAGEEPDVFPTTGHPLRRALTDLGQIAAGMGSRDAVDSDPQFAAVSRFVRELRASAGDAPGLRRVATEISRFAAAEERNARLEQQRTETAEHARVLAATAHEAIEREIQRELGHCRLPATAEELLREGWRRVMAHAQLEGGTGSGEWRRMLAGLRQFIGLWRTGAAGIPADLADMLATAMLRAGCDSLRTDILMRSVGEELASWDPPAPPPALMQVEELAEPDPDAGFEATLAEVDALPRGVWFAFMDGPIEIRRARLALRCGEPRQLLFVDRHGRRACCIGREEFAAGIAAERVRPLAGGDPFGRALARVRERLQRPARAA